MRVPVQRRALMFAGIALIGTAVFWLALSLGSDAAVGTAAPKRVSSRGYMTTAAELAVVRRKAQQGLSPYREAVSELLNFARDPEYWPYGDIKDKQRCKETLEPAYIGDGSPLIYAKAIAYHLTGRKEYAGSVRQRLLDLVDTHGYGGDKYTGGNQCILNLSWYMPGFIMAADLIEDYPEWTPEDKKRFQEWLATEVYKKVDWASDRRSNNWGSAASATAGIIADYLDGSGLLVIDREGRRLTPKQAYDEARAHQLARIEGNQYMDNYNCHQPVGIRSDGGIPEELARGSSGCDGTWIKDEDGSWNYTQTYLQGTILHAEYLLRRGDKSIYEKKTSAGAPAILAAIHFVIDNPRKPRSWRPTSRQSLELAYRYYRDPAIGEQLHISGPKRYIGGRSGQMLHFGTITHAMAPDENPSPPPVVAPPSN